MNHSSFIIHHSSFIIHHSLNTALPLDELLLRLENEGFALDIGRRVRLLRALEKQGHRFLDPDEFQNLKYLIAPLVARSAREQERFYEVFDAFRAACVQEWEDWEKQNEIPSQPGKAIAPKKPQPPQPVPLWRRYWLPLLLFAFFLAKPFIQTALKKYQAREPVVRLMAVIQRPGEDTLRVRNFSFGMDSTLFRWRVLDAETGAVHFTDSAYHFAWPVRDAGRVKIVELSARHPEAGLLADSVSMLIKCTDPPAAGQITAPDSALLAGKSYTFHLPDTEPGCPVFWLSPDGDTLRGARAQFAFENAGTFTVRAYVQRPGQERYCYAERDRIVTVGTDKPYLALLPLQEDTPRPQYRLHRWLWLLTLLPLLPAIWFFRRWKRRRAEKTAEKTTAELEQDYLVLDDKPYHIPYRPQEHKITVPRAFFRIAEVLHRREQSLRRSFDVPESVRATIEGAGFPVLRERAGAQPAAYLFLTERRDDRDQQGRLFTRLSEFLLRRETPAVFFEHDGAFDRFRNTENPDGLDLAELRRRYPGHRLVLLGNAHTLVQTPDGKPAALRTRIAVELARWPRRLLLSPEPPAAWAYQEKILHTAFLLFPADTDGMLDGFELLDRTEEHDPGPFDRWRAAQLERRTDLNHRHNAWQTPSDHRLYLLDDPDAYRWLCALAVCVQPDWALTLAIGRAIGVDVTHDRLLKLTRIPWLSANQPDDSLRLAFLRDLDPADERAAREVVAEELEAVREQTENGFANIERRTNLAVQYFALDPRDETHRQTLRDLRALGLLSGSHEAELDQVVEQKISPNELPAGTPRTLGGLLSVPVPRRWFTRDMAYALALLAFALLLGSCAWWLQTCTTPPLGSAPLYRTVVVSDPAVELNNSAVGIYRKVVEQPDFESWSNLSNSVILADSLLDKAVLARRPAAYPLADSNSLALRYNQAALGFNFFLDGATSGILIGRENAPKEKPENSNFSPERAIATPSLLLGYAIAFVAVAGDSASFAAAGDARRLNALHAYGLCTYYQDDTLGARSTYERLLRVQPQYFDTLRASMPVNLQTLLAATNAIEPLPLLLDGLVLDAETKRPLPGAVVLAADANRITFSRLENTPRDRWGQAGIYADTTGPDGRYTLRLPADVKIAQLQLRASAPGYNPDTRRAASRSPLPDLRLTPSAAAREAAAWAIAEKENTPDAYREYLRQFSNGPNAAAARSRMEAGNREQDNAREIAAWGRAEKTNTPEAYEDYLKQYPDGPNAREARSRSATGAASREQNAWQEIQKNATASAYEGYLKQYPTGQFAAIARQRIAELRDDQAWERARTANTAEACEQYLREYPQGQHAEAARACINREQQTATAPLRATGPRPGQDMVLVRGGTYTMGCRDKKRDGDCFDNEKPAHDVTVSDFYIDRTEVTNAQYTAFLNEYGSDKVRDGQYKGETMIKEYKWGVQQNAKTGRWEPAPGKDKHPVVYVSWYGAAEYARFYGMRLPTEAEWEYAARGGQRGQKLEYMYAGSDNPNAVAWYDGNSSNTTHPVGQKKANQLGLYDMSGNVWEWCSDWFGAYPSSAVTNPTGPDKGSNRVLRGGSWNRGPAVVRAALRYRDDQPSYRNSYCGFRLARAAGGG